MLNQTVDTFIKRIKSVVIKDPKMTNIPLAYLTTLDIPESVKHFLDQEVELWLREEETKFSSEDRFDYDMPQVRMLIDQIFDLLKQNANFHVNKFNQLLERAVKLEMNYLIEPHRTLSQFIFKDNDVVSTMEVYDTLKYFFKYEYYKNAISNYFNLKYLRQISRNQFEDLVNQIDEKAFAGDPVETTLKTIKTIISFISEAEDRDVDNLSYDVLIAALKDRNLTEFSELVEKAQAESAGDRISFIEIDALLRDGALPGKEEEPVLAAELDEMEDIETSKPEVAVESIEMEEMQLEEEEEEEELVEEEEIEEFEEEYEEEEEVMGEGVAEMTHAGNVADDLADHVAKQIQSDHPLNDLNNMIGWRSKRRFVKRLFRKKEDEYSAFLERINQIQSWKQASKVIDDEFYNREINPYSKEAIALSDIIYLRFFPKDKYVGEESSEDKFI